MEDIEYWLEPELLHAVAFDVEKNAERLKRLASLAERIKEIRGRVEVKELGRPRAEHFAYAVDSSYGSPPLELIGGVFTVVAYGYVGRERGKGVDKHLSGALYFEDRDESDVSRFAALLERRLAARLLRQRARGAKDFDVLILDGEIAVHPLPFNLAVPGGKYEEANKAVDSLLGAAKAAGVALVAVAKRVRSRLLSAAYGGCLPVNDRAAATLVLRPGEYFVLGKLSEVLPKWAEMHYAECEGREEREEVLACASGGRAPKGERAARLCQRIKEFRANFAEVLSGRRYPNLPLLGEVQVAYYRPPGSQTAIRAEVLDFSGAGVDEVLAYLSATSSTVTGYPEVLDEVDKYVRVDPSFVESVLMMLLRKAPGEVAEVLLPNNLQKFRRLF
ncbi:MAG: DNA double-strand break repair nuclease NurA [Thermoproteus sp. AZ2]|uniref:DNA double-strand break repair nuclease NurA n=1 Tax=Thermoproteus sp. AZ2 TaxID=1609232 RepID=A0ACC6V359_9CREN